jgi:plasmid replication initiation protein
VNAKLESERIFKKIKQFERNVIPDLAKQHQNLSDIQLKQDKIGKGKKILSSIFKDEEIISAMGVKAGNPVAKGPEEPINH